MFEQEGDWERRALDCREAVGRIAWLAGTWRGHGMQDGVARVCEVETRILFDGTFVESRERIFTSDGVLDHEDLTIYGASPEQGPGTLWAESFMHGGVVVHYNVRVSGDAITCEPTELGARLAVERTSAGYRVRIFYPDEHGAWSEGAVVEYTPRD